MTDHELLVSLYSQISAQLGTSPAVVVPAPAPVTLPAPHPTIPGVMMLTFATHALATKIQVAPGVLYAAKLPKVPSAGTVVTRDPASPPNMTVEMAYSQTPGDFEWGKTASPFYYPFMPTVAFYPGYTWGNIESCSLWFGPVVGQNTCKLNPINEDWYMNLRVHNASGPLLYAYT